ncbi:MAG: GntR family transcriptional regulator [Candidatus Puniceispirillaceae bacterium]
MYPQQVNLIKAIIADMDAEKRPIYHELAAVIANQIKSNKIKRGIKLPPNRVLGWELGLSPVTVQRAYSELERYSLIDVRVGDGSYVLDSNVKNYHQFRNAPIKNIVNSENNFSENDTETTHSLIDLSRNQSFLPIDNSKWKGLADLSSIAENTLFSLLNYKGEQGLLEHRHAGANWLNKLGEPISADNIFLHQWRPARVPHHSRCYDKTASIYCY